MRLFASAVKQVTFPKMPILGYLIEAAKCDFSKTYLLSSAHVLETNGSLYQALVKQKNKKLALRKGLVCPKHYSTSKATVHKMRCMLPQIKIIDHTAVPDNDEFEQHYRLLAKRACERAIHDIKQSGCNEIIILSDGGTLWERARILQLKRALPQMKNKIIACEQTRYGLYQLHHTPATVPVVNMAQSQLKNSHEPNPIAGIAYRKLLQSLVLSGYASLSGCTFGVIGTGNIGMAMIKYLVNLNHRVFIFDSQVTHNIDGVIQVKTVETLILSSDIIIGCSGQNVLRFVEFAQLFKQSDAHKIFASLSSCDTEFLALKRYLLQQSTWQRTAASLADISYHQAGRNVTLLRAGYPINFDGSPYSLSVEESVTTRALLLTSILQAKTMLDNQRMAPGLVALEPERQAIISKWLLSHCKPKLSPMNRP